MKLEYNPMTTRGQTRDSGITHMWCGFRGFFNPRTGGVPPAFFFSLFSRKWQKTGKEEVYIKSVLLLCKRPCLLGYTRGRPPCPRDVLVIGFPSSGCFST